MYLLIKCDQLGIGAGLLGYANSLLRGVAAFTQLRMYFSGQNFCKEKKGKRGGGRGRGAALWLTRMIVQRHLVEPAVCLSDLYDVFL